MKTLSPVGSLCSAPLVLVLMMGCRDRETGDPASIDADGDGAIADADCDDSNNLVSPNAAEGCNGIDDDCDGVVDESDAVDAATYYLDVDGDGYGNGSVPALSCAQPPGYVADATDCDDNDAMYHPGAAEADCGDANDYNCDGSTGFADADADGFAACADCDDNDKDVHVGATEICNDVDDDCDGDADESGAVGASTWFADADNDTFGTALVTTQACDPPAGFVANNLDCRDTAESVHPGAPEACDGLDNDCDGTIDDGAGDTTTYYRDLDGDGHGDPALTVRACAQPWG